MILFVFVSCFFDVFCACFVVYVSLFLLFLLLVFLFYILCMLFFFGSFSCFLAAFFGSKVFEASPYHCFSCVLFLFLFEVPIVPIRYAWTHHVMLYHAWVAPLAGCLRYQ